jgi:hypothetical protein
LQSWPVVAIFSDLFRAFDIEPIIDNQNEEQRHRKTKSYAPKPRFAAYRYNIWNN